MKVLVVGLGSIARRHIKILKDFDSSVIVYALRSNHKAESIDGVINIYSFEDVYKLYLDFAILSNPTGVHFQYLNLLKKIKIPLFIEKPLFDTTGKEQDELVDSIIIDNIPTYIACNLRFLDSLVKIKDIIKHERVNEVNVYCGSYLPDWRPNIDFRAVYSANKEMGGGVHLDLIHELDYVYWLFGEPIKTTSVFGNISSLDISSNDYANYVWVYNNFVVSIVLNYYRKDAKRSLELVCESGTFYVDLLKNNILFNNRVIFESKQLMIETYQKQMIFFINEICQNKNDFNSIGQANKILRLCLKD